MKNPNLKIILIAASFVLFVSLACGLSKPSDPTATELPAVETVVIDEPKMEEPVVIEDPVYTEETVEPEPEPEPTRPKIEKPEFEETPVEEDFFYDEPQAFFVEEFDGDLSSWSYFLMNGDESKMNLYTENGRLVFDLPARNLWVYLLYDEFIYSDVQIEAYGENLGKNSNNVSLICNYSDRFGWYEFNITNGGKYYIYAFSELDGGYFELASGGSKNLRMGRNTNSYMAVCRGNYMALYINGVLEREFTDKRFNLRDGLVGLGVSSFEVLPILVEFDYFAIREP